MCSGGTMIKCDKCEREFKDGRGMRLHKCVGAEQRPPAAPAPVGEAKEASPIVESKRRMVVFRSPRVRDLRIVITPSFNKIIEGPAGSYITRVAGKTAEFRDGIFRTDDPEIIEYLSKYSEKRENGRYPIISTIDMENMKKCL